MVRIERTIKLRKTARLRTGCLWVVEVAVRPLHPQASVSPATCSIMQHELRLARLIGLASMSFAAKVAALRSYMGVPDDAPLPAPEAQLCVSPAACVSV